MQSRIACLDLDAFFVEAALKEKPELRGKPVAIGGSSKRSVICSASYEARKYGIRSAMPGWIATNKCPSLIFLPIPDNIISLSNAVQERLKEISPIVEPASIDEFYLDFTGCDRIYPNNLKLAEKILDELAKNPGLPSTIGFGTNKLISKIASNLGKPKGILEVLPGSEKAFLSELPIKEIPGIGKKMESILHSMAVYYVKDILHLPLQTWKSLFGQTGEYIFESAQGICKAKVTAPESKSHRKSISRDITLQKDTCSQAILYRHLSYLVEKVTYSLQKEKMTCGVVTVKIRYSDFNFTTKSMKLKRTNDERNVYNIAVALLKKTLEYRGKIRLIGVHLGSLQYGNCTPDLFEFTHSNNKLNPLEIVKIIREKYGFDSILRSASVR